MKKKLVLIMIFFILTTCKEKNNMNAEHRISGDIKGIWLMNNVEDVKLMKKFLNYNDDMKTLGYCIKVSENSDTAKVYFTITDEVFRINFNKISETGFLLKYGDNERTLNIIKTSAISNKNVYLLEWYYDDSNKYDSKKTGQYSDGVNFYDVCSERKQYKCSVEGCLQYIKDLDDIAHAEESIPQE